MKKILAILISLFLVLSIFLYSIDYMATDISYYNNFHKKYEISKISKLDEDWIEVASESLVEFIENGNKQILKNYFNDKEIRHMEDVYKLFILDRLMYKGMFLSSIILIIVYLYYFKFCIFKYLKIYFIRVFTFILGFFLALSAVFSVSFEYFHRIFFNNDLWILDYETDFMIRILPEEFFFNMFLKIIFLTFVSVILIYFLICIFKSKLKYESD